jgi:hypothetical protein
MPPIDDIVLIVAYHYPPDPGIGGARPYRFAKYLKRMGYRIHVIAASHVHPSRMSPTFPTRFGRCPAVELHRRWNCFAEGSSCEPETGYDGRGTLQK